jgi:hypothetical protein
MYLTIQAEQPRKSKQSAYNQQSSDFSLSKRKVWDFRPVHVNSAQDKSADHACKDDLTPVSDLCFKTQS